MARFEQVGVSANIASDDIAWYTVDADTAVTVAGYFNSGGGTVTVRRRSPGAGTTPPLLDASNSMAPAEFTGSFETTVLVSYGDEIGIGVSGASNLDLDLTLIGKLSGLEKYYTSNL